MKNYSLIIIAAFTVSGLFLKNNEVLAENHLQEYPLLSGFYIVQNDSDFKSHLKQLFNSYLELKDAFVKTDVSSVLESAKKVDKALKKIKDKKNDKGNKWAELNKSLNESLDSILGTTDIEKQRIIFSDLSASLYESLKEFKIEGLDAYYQFCPHAKNSKGTLGAYWLSKTEEIQNPYFGNKMLHCGMNTERLD